MKEKQTGCCRHHEERMEQNEECCRSKVKAVQSEHQCCRSKQTVAEEAEDEDQASEVSGETAEDQVVDLAAKVAELEQQLAESHHQLMLAKADFENFRRRNRKETEERLKYAPIAVLEPLLPVVDNFARARELANSKDSAALLEGIEMVYRQLCNVLEQLGLEKIEALAQTFDPNLHNIVAEGQSSEHDPDVILEELQVGYKYLERIVRPSQVKVNK